LILTFESYALRLPPYLARRQEEEMDRQSDGSCATRWRRRTHIFSLALPSESVESVKPMLCSKDWRERSGRWAVEGGL
jgi:hypothetical protein